MDRSLFALERYDAAGAAAAPRPLPAMAPVRLVAVVHLPADEVVLVIAEGPDEATVTAALEGAGWRVDRVGPATWLLPEGGATAGPDRLNATKEPQ